MTGWKDKAYRFFENAISAIIATSIAVLVFMVGAVLVVGLYQEWTTIVTLVKSVKSWAAQYIPTDDRLADWLRRWSSS